MTQKSSVALRGFVDDIDRTARHNQGFREVVFTGPKSQLVVMSLRAGEEIGLEVHDGDQILYVVEGEGIATLDGVQQHVEDGSIVFVPTGVQHNLVSSHAGPLKLFTVYSPPQHEVGWPEEAPPDVDSEPESQPIRPTA